jgi:hypothetical protein
VTVTATASIECQVWLFKNRKISKIQAFKVNFYEKSRMKPDDSKYKTKIFAGTCW